MRIVIYYQELGGHTHMRVFVGGGKAGDLAMTNAEFVDFRAALAAIGSRIVFEPELPHTAPGGPREP